MKLYALILIMAAAGLGQVPHQHHPPLSSTEYAKILEDPSRDAWQKPHEVVMALGLKPTDVVADIGAGTGYFARRFATHAGKVYAVDIDKELLAIAQKSSPANVVTVLAAPDDLDQGHRTQVWLAASDDAAALVTGGYFFHLRPRAPVAATHDVETQERLLEACKQFSGVELPAN